MTPRVLLVNPPIYDFTAYDFWLKPYGLLEVAGHLRGRAELALFDYLDRAHPAVPNPDRLRRDAWGRGEFHADPLPTPPTFAGIRRHYRRFGLPRDVFRTMLAERRPFDVALVQTVMTYWYGGVREVIEDLRALAPGATIVLGGVYATLCPGHARGLGADLVVEGTDLAPLWQYLGLAPDPGQTPLWEAYPNPTAGVMKLSDGCPFRCTYCSVPAVYGGFAARPLERSVAELEQLARLGVRNVAFYDDALLCDAQRVLLPVLDEARRQGLGTSFHTPNALNARFLTRDLADAMVAAGVATFYLGFESGAAEWQRATGGKVTSDELAAAVDHLRCAGADRDRITAYLILGHPDVGGQRLEASMRFVHGLGVRITLAEFSPIPGTPDGETCRRLVDLDEPLAHNKTAFAVAALGETEVNRLKQLGRDLNATLGTA